MTNVFPLPVSFSGLWMRAFQTWTAPSRHGVSPYSVDGRDSSSSFFLGGAEVDALTIEYLTARQHDGETARRRDDSRSPLCVYRNICRIP